MSTLELLDSLLVELGFPRLNTDGASLLFSEDDTEVTLEHDPVTNETYLLADFGPIICMMGERFCYRLLAANIPDQEEGGARFEIDSSERSLIRRLPIFTSSLDAERLDRVVSRFQNSAVSWNEKFDAEMAAKEGELTPSSE